MGDEYETSESGAALFYPAQCSALRKNQHCLIKGRPCKIVDMSTSKTGKHGHAKVHLTALDIFTGKKLEDICPSTHNMDVPIVTRTEFQVIDYDEDGKIFTLMDDSGVIREDLVYNPAVCDVDQADMMKMVDEVLKGDSDRVMQASVVCSMEEEHIKDLKIVTNKSK